ncbi:MAG: DsbA family protein [Paracoccus sp. (in: a-proteobacteria)]|uniref:DsbA family protein n=1 Tax=Paracoccus sp. TaxID=267 RepID=UPI0026DFF653|nr:DsbA family protein [Paracoccus sp. (in: a-proteobacteria)]MDO5622275.1 DsbA family protein [Paracoccus sp. (in: a-proteobacteria)]
MLTRRETLAIGSAAFVVSASGAALAQDRKNPMPDELRRAIERDPASPVLGNPNGDVTLTEFFDYNCQYCRRMLPTVQRLIADDKNLRVVFWEWPVFGEGSMYATQVSLSALRQGKYWQFHSGLMAQRGQANEVSAMRVAREVGLDMDRVQRDMQSDAVFSQIDKARELGDHMGLIGTPTFIAGDEGVFGHQTMDSLKAMIAEARRVLG